MLISEKIKELNALANKLDDSSIIGLRHTNNGWSAAVIHKSNNSLDYLNEGSSTCAAEAETLQKTLSLLEKKLSGLLQAPSSEIQTANISDKYPLIAEFNVCPICSKELVTIEPDEDGNCAKHCTSLYGDDNPHHFKVLYNNHVYELRYAYTFNDFAVYALHINFDTETSAVFQYTKKGGFMVMKDDNWNRETVAQIDRVIDHKDLPGLEETLQLYVSW